MERTIDRSARPRHGVGGGVGGKGENGIGVEKRRDELVRGNETSWWWGFGCLCISLRFARGERHHADAARATAGGVTARRDGAGRAHVLAWRGVFCRPRAKAELPAHHRGASRWLHACTGGCTRLPVALDLVSSCVFLVALNCYDRLINSVLPR